MSNTAFETLKRLYPTKFTERRHRDKQHYVPAFVIYGGASPRQYTISDSNAEAIHEELRGEFPHAIHRGAQFSEDVYAYVDDLESNEALADKVLEILRSFDERSIYNEDHYYDLEDKRLAEYMHSTLVSELARELGRGDVEEIEQWVRNNEALIWKHNDGSVDGEPFNDKDIAALVP